MEFPGARIAVLGGPSIEWDDGPSSPASMPGVRAELVFAYLAVEHRRSVPRDELANALWPELLPDSWAAALRGVVTDVRRFLDDSGLAGSELIAGARGGYRLQLPPGVTVDVDDAREGLADARARLARDDAAGAANSASRAASLTGLTFLPRHDGEWVQKIREELEAIHTAALELGARAHARSGDARAASATAERLVRVEPYREAAHQLLIEVLGQAGDRAGAIQAYERCRAGLRSELGLEPSAETEAVLQRALAGHARAGPARTALAVETAGPGQSSPALASYAVLVVEDHDFQRRTALALLRRLGVGTLLEAADGNAALELLAEVAPPDVILCDIDMPGMDGVEFIRHVARRGLASAVAIASGLDRSLLETVRAMGEGYGLQVLGAVEKPLTARVLTDLLGAYAPAATLAEHGGARRLSAAEIADGIAEGCIVVHLEPIADLSTGRIAAAEVVPRWHDPTTATVGAASFMAALETPETTERFSNRLVELGSQVVRELVEAGLAIEIAIRLPDGRLGDPGLADRLAAVAHAGGADPRHLVLSIGAAALPGGAAVALDVLARLRLKGFGLWLDEAGSGTRLDRLPLTGVRLAADLLSRAVAHPPSAASLQDAVDQARGRRLVAIGTGCASAAEFELLLEVGASHAQGPFVADAMPARELADWARRWTPPMSVPDDAP